MDSWVAPIITYKVFVCLGGSVDTKIHGTNPCTYILKILDKKYKKIQNT